MAEYELNGDMWYYHGHEYHRGDLVPIPDDLDDAGKAHIEQLIAAGSLVKPGFAKQLADEQAEADAAAEKRRLEQVAFDDAEANRLTALNNRLLHGDPDFVPKPTPPKPGPRTRQRTTHGK